MTAELRKLLGPHTLTVVYLDARPRVRRRRGVHGSADVTARDQDKQRSGAHHVLGRADVVIDNDHSLTRLGHTLDGLVRGRVWPWRRPRVLPASRLCLPDHLTEFVGELCRRLTGPAGGVDMIAITGCRR